ncbi:hypothetical protein [Sorangium cellulosum]|uniref:Uncharacterized protein n=1 Tax=Sorangium cellulosum So0157-2 TaxID=1254432 RepID=S4Y071_SORCE|nr:hypothetical protein [Sorangium cellulosum]AGP37540.1 hypothetical protein SCE1572_25430 [Sorangium cellulosum So0157-2]
MIKASQAISSEIVLDELLCTLLTAVLEQGGAQRACLVLVQDDRLSIEAEATLGESGAATVVLPRATEAVSRRVPASLVRYVYRTKERVILGHAAADAGRAQHADDVAHAHARGRPPRPRSGPALGSSARRPGRRGSR